MTKNILKQGGVSLWHGLLQRLENGVIQIHFCYGISTEEYPVYYPKLMDVSFLEFDSLYYPGEDTKGSF